MNVKAPTPKPNHPTSYALILYPGFQALDVFGPLDALNILSSEIPNLSLSIIAPTLSPVSTKHPFGPNKDSNFGESVVPTHTFDNPPDNIEVLFIPGGYGTRDEEIMGPMVECVKGLIPRVKYVLTVCTGSIVLARTGLLDGKRATTNKKSFIRALQQRPQVNWITKARWVVSDNFWTSSGISAGMDLMYAFISFAYGEPMAEHLANCGEYERQTDPDSDRFAEVWGTEEVKRKWEEEQKGKAEGA